MFILINYKKKCIMIIYMVRVLFYCMIHFTIQMVNVYALAMHLYKTDDKYVFSKAAATLSLSSNCLLMACSDVCVPGVMVTDILKRGGRHHKSLTLIDNPINVAILQ